jgi:TIGR03009 family protein
MARQKSILVAVLTVHFAVICGVAAAQNRGDAARGGQERGGAVDRGNARTEPAAAKMTTQQLLKLWERQSQLLKDLQVSIYRIDKLPDWDEEIHYDGTAKFKTPQLAFLDFKKIKTKVVPDPKNPKKDKVVDLIDSSSNTNPPARLSDSYERIVCTGKEVWHYRFDKKTAYIYPLNKEAQRRALDEGPLPFLFNMRVDDALARYQMSLQGETEKVYFVVIKPKLKADQESFSTAWVWLDRTYLLPVRITLLSPDNQSVRDFQLSKIAANQGVNNDAFRGGKFPGWTVERNPTAPDDGPVTRPASRRNQLGQGAQRGGVER